MRLSPERRKITVTPYFPMKSSGLSTLPFLPSCEVASVISVVIDETSDDHFSS